MQEEKNKALVREYIEQVWNRKRTDLLEQYLAEDINHYDAPELTDRASMKSLIDAFQKAFPDFRITIDVMIADGDMVAYSQNYSGTQEGEFNGIPATGKRFSVSGTYILRIADGKVTEIRGHGDNLGMMQQLGVIPVLQSN